MNAQEAKPSVFSDDREVVGEIEHILPQSMVASLRERLLQDGMYDKIYADAFNELSEKFKQIGFVVHDPLLRKVFDIFKENLLAFDDVLISNFGQDRIGGSVFSIHAKRKNNDNYSELIGNLRATHDAFEKSYRNLLQTASEKFHPSSEQMVIHLSECNVRFSKEEGAVFADERRCELPAFKNGYDLCKVMFNKSPKHPVDWSEVADEMSGKDPIRRSERLRLERQVRDAMYAVNEKIKQTILTEDDLFTWKNKTIVRNF